MFKNESTKSNRQSKSGKAAKRHGASAPSRRKMELQVLEPRVLLDAAAAATAQHMVEQAHQAAAPEQHAGDAHVGAALAQVDRTAAAAPSAAQLNPLTELFQGLLQGTPAGQTANRAPTSERTVDTQTTLLRAMGGSSDAGLGATPRLQAADTGFAPTVNAGHSLLVDGSFEANGWTAQKGSPEHGTAAQYGVGAIEGKNVVEVEGAKGSTYVQETLNNLVAGQTYTLSWYAHTRTNGGNGAGNDLGTVNVSGTTDGNLQYDFETSRTEWTRYTVTFTAEGTSANIRFTSRGNTDGSSATDGIGLILDAARLDVDHYETGYTENGDGVAVVADDALITDLDSSNLQSMTVKVANGHEGDVLSIAGALPAGITASYDAATYTLTLSGAATSADYAAAMKAVRYSSTTDALDAEDRNIVINANDGVNNSPDSLSVVKITPVNDAPVPVKPSTDVPGQTFDEATGEYTATLSEDGSIAGKLEMSDADGDPISFSAGTRPAHGTLVINPDGTYTYTPAADFNGTDSFTVLADDGHGGVVPVKVNVVVDSVNDAPVAKDVAYDIDKDTAVNMDLLVNDSDAEDGKPVIDSINGVKLTGGAQTIDVNGGQVIIAAGGTMEFVPTTGATGNFSFDYVVRDSEGLLDSATVRINVASEENGPVPVKPETDVPGQGFDDATGAYSLDVTEDTPASGQVFATDPDGDAISFSAGTRPAHGTLVVNPDGSYTYTPAADYNGSDVFTILADDGNGGVTPITVKVGVDSVNDAPVAKGVSATTAEDTSTVLDLTANDSDAEDGKPMVDSINGVSLTGGAQIIDVDGGQVVIDAAGVMTFVPAADANGTFSFDYTVRDSDGATASATATMNVTPVNDAARLVDPQIDGQDFNAATGTTTIDSSEDTPVNGRIAAIDPEGDPLSYSVGTEPEHGTLVLNQDGSYTYVPDADFNGIDSFVVMVDDGSGNLTPATVVINSAPVQDAPIAADPGIDGQSFDRDTGITTVTADEGTPVDGKIGVIDPDGDPLSYAVDTQPEHGTLVINDDGTYTYTPADGFSGADSFVVMVTDDAGNATAITVDLNVQPEAPQLVDPAIDGQSFDPATGTTTVTSAEDTPVNGRIAADDLQGDDLSFAVDTLPEHGTLVVNPDGTYTYTPDPDFNGTDSFVVLVTDDKGNVTPATVVINSEAVNDAPVAADPGIDGQSFDPATGITTVTANEGEAVDGKIGVVDPDGDPLSYAVDTQPEHGTLVINDDGTYTYTPADGFSGADSFVVMVSDGSGGMTAITVDMNVQPEAPQLVDPAIDGQSFDPATGTTTVTSAEDTPVNGRIAADDLQGDDLSFAVDTLPEHGTLVVNPDGTYTYTPDPDFNGTDSFVVLVTDDKGNVTPATVVINSEAVNDAPVAADPGIDGQSFDPATGITTVTANEGEAVDGKIGVIDPDGDPLSYAVDTQPEHGTLVINDDGSYTYTPADGFSGADSFVVMVSDGSGGMTAITVDLNVQPEAPQLVDPAIDGQSFDPATGTTTVTSAEDTPVNGRIAADDLQGDDISFAVDTLPEHGTLVVNPDGTYTYTPDADFNGTDSFVVLVTDDKGNVTPATVVINSEAVNDAPVAADPGIDGQSFDPATGITTVTANEGEAVDGKIGVVDPDGDPLSYAVDTQPEHGTLVINDDGTYTYTPADGFSGADSFVVMVSDGSGGMTAITVDLNVQPEAPQLVDPAIDGQSFDPATGTTTVTSAEDTPVNGRIAADDLQGDDLSFAVDTQPEHGTLVVNPDGTYTYTPDPDFNGTDSFVVLVTDDKGNVTPATVVINSEPTQDAPRLVDPQADGQDFDAATGTTTISGTEDTPVSGKVGVVDPDGDALSYAIDTQPEHGTLVVNPDGTYTYTPDADFNGTDSFVIMVDDGHGNLTPANFVVNTAAVEDAPRLVDPQIPGQDFDPASGTTTATSVDGAPVDGRIGVVDPDGDPLSFAVDTQPAHGTLVVNPDGSYIYTPDAGFTGQDSFVIMVDDGHGNLTPATVVINNEASSSYHDDTWDSGANADDGVNRDDGGIASGDIAAGGLSDLINDLDSLNGTTLAGGDAHDAFNDLVDQAMAKIVDGRGNSGDLVTSATVGGGVSLDMIVNGEQVILNFSGHGRFHVSAANGQDFPDWIRQFGDGQLLMDRPAGAEWIRMRVDADKPGSQDTILHMLLEINLSSGESRVIETTEEHGAAKAVHEVLAQHEASAFSAQLAHAAKGPEKANADLAKLLKK